MTHEEFIEFYLNIKSLSVAPTTLDGYRRVLNRFLPLSDEISELDLIQAQEIITEMAHTGITGATIRRHTSILHQYGKYIVKYQKVAYNPFDGVEQPKKIEIDNLHNKVYSEDSLVKLFRELRTEPLMWRAYISAAIDSGARRGELVGLRWCDLDFERNCLRIQQAAFKLSGKPQATKEPKGRRSRTVYLTRHTMHLLRMWRMAQQSDTVREGYVWDFDFYIFGKNGDMLSLYAPSAWWRRFLKRHRLPVHRLHDLRHTCAALLLRNGVDVRTVSQRLGHAALKTTMLYLEPDGEAARDTMENILKKAVKNI